ncbi:MAG: glycosyltransferase, partial [Coriobacteriia bacterium]|nr:glycosyltransferase [Coriobacteriia bacterium]
MLVTEGLRSLAKRTAGKVARSLSGQDGAQDAGGLSEPCQVLFINGCDAPAPKRYRVEHQVEQLKLWNISVSEVHYAAGLHETDVDRAQVVVVYRCPITPVVEGAIKRARSQGKTVFFDTDDLVIDTAYTDMLPLLDDLSPEERDIFNDGVQRTGETLALCDKAITTTAALREQLLKYVPQVHINRNVASLEMLELSDKAYQARTQRPEDGLVRIGYFSGSATHGEDLESVADALAQVLDTCPQARLVLGGSVSTPAALQTCEDRIERFDFVEWRKLPELIATVDINIAPLTKTLFNAAKSELKWMEAALVGVPTVASRWGAFQEMVQDGTTGLLCDQPEEWADALTRLVNDSAYRNTIAVQARRYCRACCTTAGSGFALVEALGLADRSLDNVLCPNEMWRNALVADFLGRGGFTRPEAALPPDAWKTEPLDARLLRLQEALEGSGKTALLVYERDCGDDNSFRYLGYNVAKHLERSSRWSAVYFFLEELDALSEHLAQADVVVLVRMRMRPDVFRFALDVKAAGVPLAYAIDDNALGQAMAPSVLSAMNVAEGDDFATGFWRGTCQRFEDAATLCDCFISTSGYLAQVLNNRYGKPAFTIHNSLNEAQVQLCQQLTLGRTTPETGRFYVGYFSGTMSHAQDFDLLKQPLYDFLDRNAGARLVLAGRFMLDDYLLGAFQCGKVKLLPFVDYLTLQGLQACCNVVLAPLVVDEFTNCKSALKVFEAGLMGTPSCASPTFCNNEAIQTGETGFLCETPQQWYDALQQLHDNPQQCAEMGAAAQQAALDRYFYGMPGEIECAFDGAAAVSLTLDTYERLVQTVADGALASVDWDDPFA